MQSERTLKNIQNSKLFFIIYLLLPFVIYELTKIKEVFYYYFIASLFSILAICIFRIIKEQNRKDYDLGVLTAVKIAHICTILYTPKYVWIISGFIIFGLFSSFTWRHSKVRLPEIWENKFSFGLYITTYLVLFFKIVPADLLLGIYGIQIAIVFAYTLYCAMKTNFFYRGLLYASVAIVCIILIGRYSIETASSVYLYTEAIFIGLFYVSYLNWYNYFVYLHYLPFVKKGKSHLFYSKSAFVNIIAIVTLVVVVMGITITKAVVVNSAIIAVLVWMLYSVVSGFFNLGETIRDIADHDEDQEVANYYISLPDQIKMQIKSEVEAIIKNKQMCKECKKMFEKLEQLPEFMKTLK